VVVVDVVDGVVSTDSKLDELDTELVDTGCTSDCRLAELETDNAVDTVLEEDGTTVTLTGSLKLDDDTEQETDEDDEDDDTVAV